MNDPTNLAIRLGIKLPESIVAKMVMTADGSQAWGLSDSGMVHMPLGNLYNYPILAPETTEVFLAMDDCNRGVATGTLQINNLGKGKLTFSVATNVGSALVYSQTERAGAGHHHVFHGAGPLGRGPAGRHEYLDGRRNLAGHDRST